MIDNQTVDLLDTMNDNTLMSMKYSFSYLYIFPNSLLQLFIYQYIECNQECSFLAKICQCLSRKCHDFE